MISLTQILQEAEVYLQKCVSLRAEMIDCSPDELKKAIDGLKDHHILKIRIPEKWGGFAIDDTNFRCFSMQIARYSGALAFLQTQYQSAVSMLASSENEALKKQYLPEMVSGNLLMGVGFSQIRRGGDPLMKAVEVEGGYCLEGEVPWLTGFNFFEAFIVGATLPNNSVVYGVLPFCSTSQSSGGSISLGEPIKLGVIDSTNTVRANIKQWFLGLENVVFIRPTFLIREQDMKNVLHHGFFSLGTAQAGLDIIEKAYDKTQLPFIKNASLHLDLERQECMRKMLVALQNQGELYQQKLQLRCWAINLAGRCAQAAITVSGGEATYYINSAQRVYREALLFTVSRQNVDVMESTLNQLIVPRA